MAEADAVEQPATGGNKKLVIVIIVLVALLAGVGGAFFAMQMGSKEPAAEGTEEAAVEEEPPVESIYIGIQPEFVINFRDRNDRPKFLKTEISVATTDPDIEEAITHHMPAIRNSIVLLLSRQIYEDLLPNEGKEALRQEALAAVQAVLQAQIGKPGVNEVYFSSFVMH